MMSKVNAMMDEASKNPALVAEKQAEIKKTKKGGKKWINEIIFRH